jgi:hypothetical protein
MNSRPPSRPVRARPAPARSASDRRKPPAPPHSPRTRCDRRTGRAPSPGAEAAQALPRAGQSARRSINRLCRMNPRHSTLTRRAALQSRSTPPRPAASEHSSVFTRFARCGSGDPRAATTRGVHAASTSVRPPVTKWSDGCAPRPQPQRGCIPQPRVGAHAPTLGRLALNSCNPERIVSSHGRAPFAATPSGLKNIFRRRPRVASPTRQPWAERCNPVGVVAAPATLRLVAFEL